MDVGACLRPHAAQTVLHAGDDLLAQQQEDGQAAHQHCQQEVIRAADNFFHRLFSFQPHPSGEVRIFCLHRSPQIRNGRYLNNPYEKTAPFHAAKGRRAGRAAEGYHLGARRGPFSGFFAL